VAFWTTAKGEQAINADAFHYIDGRFVEYDESNLSPDN